MRPHRAPKPILAILSVIALTALACGLFKPLNPGQMVGSGTASGSGVASGPDTSFVSDPAFLYFATSESIERIRLDGSGRQKIFSGEYLEVQDVSPDGKLFLITDSNTNLYVGEAATGRMSRVPSLDRRTSAASFSPDGRTIAAVRHSDFSQKQSQWQDDDTLFLVDTASQQARILPPVTSFYPISIRWGQDGSGVWLGFAFGEGFQWVDLAGETRSALDQPPVPVRENLPPKPECPAKLDTAENGSVLTISDSACSRPLLRVVGRERAVGDLSADFGHYAFSPTCEYVVFNRVNDIWVAQVSSGKSGPLIERADWLFFGE